MIITFLLLLGANAYLIMLDQLPTGSLPSEVTSAVTTIVTAMFKFNAVLPVDTLFQVLGAVVVVEIAIVAFHLVQWVLKKIPILNIK